MKKLLSESILSSFEINFSFVTSSFPDFVQNQILIPGGKSTFLKYTQISGVENEQQNTFDFEIFPNPAKDKFKVQSLPAGQAGLKLKMLKLNFTI